MKKYIGRILIFCHLSACCLWNPSGLSAQETVSLGDFGSVTVTYMVVSKGMEANAIQIDNLEGTVDMRRYPDAKLRILIKADNLASNHSLYICPTCYAKSLKGFLVSNTVKQKVLKGEESKVHYTYNPDFLNATESLLKLSFYVKKGNDIVGNKAGYHSRGKEYKLLFSNSQHQETAAIGNNGHESIPKVLADYDTDPSAACNYLASLSEQKRSGFNKEVQGKIKEVDEKCQWKEILECAKNADANSKKIKCYNDYLAKNPSGKYINEANDSIKRIPQSPPSPIKKKPPTKIDPSRFSLHEKTRTNSPEDKVEIILKYDWPHEESKPTFKFMGEDENESPITPDFDKKEVKIILQKGIEEKTLIAEIPNVDFPNKNNRYKINTKYLPVSAQFQITDDGSIEVVISEGKPPFEIRFIEGGTTICNIRLEQARKKTLSREEIRKELRTSGSFTVQVFDDTGNSVEEAKSKELYESEVDNGNMFLWLLLLPVMAIAVFLFFLIWKQKASLKPEDEVKIASRLKMGTSSEEAYEQFIKSEEYSKTEPSDHVRKKITVTKKEGMSSNHGMEAGLAINNMPRLKEASSGADFEDIFMGKADEYRRVEMGDLWADSIVSDILIREVFIYRINQFVFEENKGLLEVRGLNIPEIGGWIMGKQIFNTKKGKYLVSFERFIQMHRPMSNNSTQLVFGPEAWQALEKAKDIYREEELEVVGWFHTHPGWGVFLSGDDINTHETHFKQPYSIAMELDCVKAPYEVGFFSRRKERGYLALNNRAKNYYNWSDFRNWLVNG